jgi:hypothetical protein
VHVGIIGAGNIGGNLTRRLTGLGHRVRVANSRGPETLSDLSRETGAEAVAVDEVARDAQLLIVSIPERAVPDLPEGVLRGAVADAPVIDTGNYYPQRRDGLIPLIEDGMPESVWVAQQLGQPVIKAFNGIHARHLLDWHRPAGSPDRVALPVAGDDAGAKAAVMQLVDRLGFDPVDAGTLAESWRQQPGTPVYCVELSADGVREALANASPDRPAGFRA